MSDNMQDYLDSLLNQYNSTPRTSHIDDDELSTPRKPFKFLDAYTREDSDIFFGRDDESDTLYRKVMSRKLTILYGESGTGKTSLVHCGLINRLKPEEAEIVTIRTFKNPLETTKNELFKIGSDQNYDVPINKLPSVLSAQLSKTIILFYDQFEELFIFQEQQVRVRFLIFLKNLLDAENDIRIILGIREEYFAKLTEFENVLPNFLHNKVWINKITKNKAAEIVLKACDACSVNISKATANKIMDDVAHLDKSIELPIMQVVMDNLYNKYFQKDADFSITYIPPGDSIRTIIGDFLTKQIETTSNVDNTKEVLKLLITDKGTKRAGTIDDLTNDNQLKGYIRLTENDIKSILEELKRCRVVIQDGENGPYELLHDFLAAKIFDELLSGEEKEALRVKEKIGFMMENQIELEEKFLTSIELMLKEGRLKLRNDIKNEKQLLDYILKCRESIDRRKKNKRLRKRIFTASALIVLFMFSVFMWFSYQKSEKAKEATESKIIDISEILNDYFYADLYYQGKIEEADADREGFRLMMDGKYDKASELFRDNIKRDPYAWYSYVNLGHLNVFQDKLDAAKEFYLIALKYIDESALKKVSNDFDFFIFNNYKPGEFKIYQVWFTQEYPKEKQRQVDENFILVEEGRFIMGNDYGEADEQPEHAVTLSSFYISRFELTQREWKDIMKTNSSGYKCDFGPAEHVSWYDALVYCNNRSINEGFEPVYSIKGSTNPKDWGSIPTSNNEVWNNAEFNVNANGYRMPTEAEWEFAARGGNKSKGFQYAGSNDLDEVAWHWANSGSQKLEGKYDIDKIRQSNSKPHPVGMKKPNELGIYDMSGNVWEWCWDWYGKYPSEAQNNPVGCETGTHMWSAIPGKVLRGGAWFYDSHDCNVKNRYFLFPVYRQSSYGLRLVRNASK